MTKENKHTFKVDDILRYSWGWEQTNIEFYVVVKTTPAMIHLRRIGQENTGFDMFGTTVPLTGIDERHPEILKKRVVDLGSGYGEVVRMEYGSAKLWDGTPQRYSSYA